MYVHLSLSMSICSYIRPPIPTSLPTSICLYLRRYIPTFIRPYMHFLMRHSCVKAWYRVQGAQLRLRGDAKSPQHE
ncbi:hypothetical protein FQA47_016958 [Oryzias melastigma]|uniref:Uncharacterized protein n=1 Tax=Oryzias melastigma TaxID=30732 RepID=A0A834FPV6_ORYME|nr:hypothetical protein FQA47_016958 [Oryzias melastigma]